MHVVLALLAAALLIALVLSVRREPRWSGNAFLLSITLVVCVMALVGDGGGGLFPALGGLLSLALLLAALFSPLLMILLVAFLLLNGVQMLRKEGRSLGNLLSLLAGLGVLGILILLAVSVLRMDVLGWMLPLDLLLVLACSWAGFVLGSYLLYTVVYPRVSPEAGARFVMVHGSGLIGDRVPPLLQRRVETGIGLWRQLAMQNPQAVLILSGGKGSDEKRTEASAMAEYAIAQGVPPAAILLEDRSATTAENLSNTRELVARHLGPAAPGLTVTSSYHVLRTAVLARESGLDAQVRPAPTAGYFWPSAFLREVVALVLRHRVAHAVLAALVCLPVPVLMAVALWSRGPA